MSKVYCSVEHTTADNDNGIEVECVVVTCPKCGHAVQSWGTGENSIRRSCAAMSEECPEGENNFYEAA